MNIEQRVDRLEREVRLWRRLGAAVLGLAVVGSVAATTRDGVPEVITAREIRIVGESGISLAVLGSEREAGFLKLKGKGESLASLSAANDQDISSTLLLRGPDNGAAATMWARTIETSLAIMNQGTSRAIVLHAMPDAVDLTMFRRGEDQKLKKQARWEAAAESVSFELLHAGEKPGVRLFADPTGEGLTPAR